MNIHADIHLIERVSAQLIEMLGEDFDAETFWDSLDGETDVADVIGHLIRKREEVKAFSDASKALADEYTARKRRLDDKAKAITKALGAVLDAAKQDKFVHPIGTVSRRVGVLSCKIFDETAIPSQLTITTTKPDTAAIKKLIEAGEVVPGAELVRGDDIISVRVK